MIFYGVPYRSDKNLGRAYNDFARFVPESDWICFMDADTMPTTPDYGSLIENIIADHPTISAFTCYTNRVGCPWQVAPGSDWAKDDIAFHRMFGEQMALHYGTEVDDVTKQKHVFSGFFLCIKKSLWTAIGGAKESGMLGIDNDIHRRIRNYGERLFLAKGLYFYHWYRGGDRNNIKHLI